MHRSLSGRVFSLALLLWVPLFMSGAESIVRCPTHDGGTGVVQTDHAASQVAGHDHGGSHSAPSDHGGTSHNCLCPGPSCCPPAVAVVPGSAVPLAHIVAVHAAVTVSTLERFESGNDHVLPFATAPPSAWLAPATSPVV